MKDVSRPQEALCSSFLILMVSMYDFRSSLREQINSSSMLNAAVYSIGHNLQKQVLVTQAYV
jgi:hypothetical protein